MGPAIPIVSLFALTVGRVLGQSLPAFEVASIRMNRTAGGRESVEFSPGGERFTATNTSLGQLIVTAFGVTPRQVSPLDPVIYEKYDVQAKADHPVTRPDVLRMLQALLANRFKLSIHREMRVQSVYGLVVDKRGLKVPLSKEDLPWTLARARGNEQRSGRMTFENESMPDFAYALSTLVVVGRVVVDKTGLTGNYDFKLNFAPPDRMSDPATNRDDPSIFTALQEQLGLRLEAQKAPVEFLVVEHVERASDN
jgi:uncharacterized protein (TIGR03435 family)